MSVQPDPGLSQVPSQSSPPKTALATGLPFADPAALGLGAFAMTTFVLSVINAGFIPKGDEPVVLGLALFFGGGAQFAAGIWEFANKNTFGATAFCSFGAFWLSFWYLIQFSGATLPLASAGKGVGLFLLSWTIFTAYMTIAAWRTNVAVFLVFVFLTLTFLFLTIGAFANSNDMNRVGGWLGIVTAVVAWYTSLAIVSNFTYKRTVLPVWPR